MCKVFVFVGAWFLCFCNSSSLWLLLVLRSIGIRIMEVLYFGYPNYSFVFVFVLFFLKSNWVWQQCNAIVDKRNNR